MTNSIKDTQVSIRLPSDLKDRMETYAQLTHRTKSYVAMEALKEYLVWRLPQIDDLREAIEAADRGDFASDEDVERVFARYNASDPARKRTPPKAATRRK